MRTIRSIKAATNGEERSGGAVRELLSETALRAARYASEIGSRRIVPLPGDVERLQALGGELPECSSDPGEVLALLDDISSPATVATAGGRYFGFVMGGTLPAALAANWLAGTWDQNAAFSVMSPVAAKVEEVVLAWLRDIFKLPESCGAGFVTGATMANFTALAATRHAVLKRSDWSVEEDGLLGAPAIGVGGCRGSRLVDESSLTTGARQGARHNCTH
jgi:Pyridoxal-dependent decarboxylase conserved domain